MPSTLVSASVPYLVVEANDTPKDEFVIRRIEMEIFRSISEIILD